MDSNKLAQLATSEQLTIREAARRLGLSRSKLYSLMEAGDLPYTKFGKARRIPVAALQALIERSLRGGWAVGE